MKGIIIVFYNITIVMEDFILFFSEYFMIFIDFSNDFFEDISGSRTFGTPKPPGRSSAGHRRAKSPRTYGLKMRALRIEPL